MADETFILKRWVFAGRRENQKREVYDLWYEVGADGSYVDPKAGMSFEPEKKHAPVVGAVYAIEATPDNSRARLAKRVFENMWSGDEATLLSWRALHDAVAAAQRARRDEKAGKHDSLKALAPLRDAYWSTDAVGRRAIEATVLAYLRSERRD